MLGGVVLALGQPLAARGAADRAHARSALIVDAAAVVDGELLLPAERLGDDVLHALLLERVELLVVHRRRDRGERPFYFDVGCHVSARTRPRKPLTTAVCAPTGREMIPLPMPNPRRLIPPLLRQLGGDALGLGRAAQSV